MGYVSSYIDIHRVPLYFKRVKEDGRVFMIWD